MKLHVIVDGPNPRLAAELAVADRRTAKTADGRYLHDSPDLIVRVGECFGSPAVVKAFMNALMDELQQTEDDDFHE